jgi:hypothetical protein
MEAVSRTGGGSYILGNILNMVTRSQYGRRLPQNLTRDVRPARPRRTRRSVPSLLLHTSR